MLTLTVELDDGHTVWVCGRAAWALKRLKKAAAASCAVFDIRAPRWSSYVHRLRKLGLVIDTVREGHRDRFPGHHARYVLRRRRPSSNLSDAE